MDLRLELLDSFFADGSDGKRYKVRAYDRLAPVPGAAGQWESTGQVELRLEDGTRVDVAADGDMRISGSAVRLVIAAREHA